ncbi:MAG: hypothetical protein RLY24_1249 [Actinomycetota bacterium]|jgi:hypothetical protein
MAFESHGTLGSPEAGFNKGATVVVDCMVVVVAMIGAGVVALFASGVDEQAVIDSAKRTTETTRFT